MPHHFLVPRRSPRARAPPAVSQLDRQEDVYTRSRPGDHGDRFGRLRPHRGRAWDRAPRHGRDPTSHGGWHGSWRSAMCLSGRARGSFGAPASHEGRLTAVGQRVGFEDGIEQDIDAIMWATGIDPTSRGSRSPRSRRQTARSSTDAAFLTLRDCRPSGSPGTTLGVGAHRVREGRRCLHRWPHKLASRGCGRTCPNGC
jgi:hypothetical protein